MHTFDINVRSSPHASFSCSSFQENLCALNTELDALVPMSICSLHAARCHGDPFFFANKGQCDDSAAHLDLVRFRARMANRSATAEPCGEDVCYEWETCVGEAPALSSL